MALKTKSIRAEPSEGDGLRVCIMRSYDQEKHPEYYPADEYWTELAPSGQLLKDYHKGLPWEDYVQRFTEEVLCTHSQQVKELAKRAMSEDITLLCCEDKRDNCHRNLVASACKMYQPRLRLIPE